MKNTQTSEKNWYDLIDEIHPLILTEEIENFSEWLFLRGYKTPDPLHHAFDFSAYKTTDNKKILGLPERTKIYSPLEGVVDFALKELNAMKGLVRNIEIEKYLSYISIVHCEGTLQTLLQHVTPFVKRGDCVKKGQVIGEIYHSLGKVGLLPHAHAELIYPVQINEEIIKRRANPLEIFYPNKKIETLTLPHTGIFYKYELTKAGIICEYDTLVYYHTIPGQRTYRKYK